MPPKTSFIAKSELHRHVTYFGTLTLILTLPDATRRDRERPYPGTLATPERPLRTPSVGAAALRRGGGCVVRSLVRTCELAIRRHATNNNAPAKAESECQDEQIEG